MLEELPNTSLGNLLVIYLYIYIYRVSLGKMLGIFMGAVGNREETFRKSLGHLLGNLQESSRASLGNMR